MKNLRTLQSYNNSEYATTIVYYIQQSEADKIREQLTSTSFLTILSDGSTDSAVMEQEMVFARFVTEGGQVEVKFLGVKDCEKANAAGIFQAIKSAVTTFLDWDIFLAKLVALGCDGASVMVGQKNGVSKLLKDEQPCMVTIHCFAHRLELAMKDSVKKCKLYDKVVRVLLMGLYYFYHNSPLNRSMLKRSFTSLTLKAVLPTRVGGTRWVGHTVRALTNYIRGYPAVRNHLEQVRISSKSVSPGFIN